jgi:type IV secretion system protein VirD4
MFLEINLGLLFIVGVIGFGTIGVLSMLAHMYTLNGIKSRTVGHGQHGTARWASPKEIFSTYTQST